MPQSGARTPHTTHRRRRRSTGPVLTKDIRNAKRKTYLGRGKDSVSQTAGHLEQHQADVEDHDDGLPLHRGERGGAGADTIIRGFVAARDAQELCVLFESSRQSKSPID